MIERPYIRQGFALFRKLETAANHWPGLQSFLNNLRNNGTDSEQEAQRANYVKLRDEIDAAAHEIYKELEDYKKRALSEEGNLVYPGLVPYQRSLILLLMSFRSSGDPCS